MIRRAKFQTFQSTQCARKLTQENISNSNNLRCAGRHQNKGRNYDSTGNDEGQAEQLSITTCRSTAARCLPGYTERPPR